MKLLFDANLSRKLLGRLLSLFPGSVHVNELGLKSPATDREIWTYAGENGFAVITGDRDFLELAKTSGPSPKVILLENCDYPTKVAEALIVANAIRIAEFAESERNVLILRRT